MSGILTLLRQGGAADLVIAAMVKLHEDEELKKMNWNLLLQIHDEVIMVNKILCKCLYISLQEGPEETAEIAFKRVKEIMENPFRDRLKLNLEISSSICDNWYEAK